MRRAPSTGPRRGPQLADGNATSKCEPFRVVSDHNGFGNAIFALYRAFAQAQRCGTSVEILSNKAKHDRLSRICARLTCEGAAIRDQGSFKWGEDPSRPALDLPPFARERLPAGLPVAGGKRIHVTRVAVDASKFTPSNNGEWLAPLTVVIMLFPSGKFATAAHIRSIRFDFEKVAEGGPDARARTHPDDRENDTMSSYMGRDDGHMLYDVDEWRFLASHVMDDVVYIASDNAPARDELAMRIADLGGTACFVAQSVGPLVLALWGGGRRPRPDGLVVSSASSNHPPDRPAVPRSDRALVPVQSQKMSERLGQARPQQRRDGHCPRSSFARGAPALRGYSNAGLHVR